MRRVVPRHRQFEKQVVGGDCIEVDDWLGRRSGASRGEYETQD